MKVNKVALPVLGLLLIIGSSVAQVPWTPKTIDWTTVPTPTILQSSDCYTQIKNIKTVWTGDCEGSYAAMAASAIQDNICITFDRISNTLTSQQRALKAMKVSYQDIICNCENCHQTQTMGCLGGNLETTLEYLKFEGFVGGSDFTSKNPFSVDGITFKTPTFWKYNNCLGFFKNYCDESTEAGCGAQ